MSDASAATAVAFDSAFMAQLADLEVSVALAELQKHGLATPQTAHDLAHQALDEAEAASARAAHWLALGDALNHQLGDDPTLQGWLAYAQARLYTQAHQWSLAETAIRAAQEFWQTAGDQAGSARSYLGLTQILAVQGRYADAERANRAAITLLGELVEQNDSAAEQLASAHNNLANLLVYQEQHRAALVESERARQILEDRIATLAASSTPVEPLLAKLADVEVNRANALMSLDATYEAEAALQTAVNRYVQLDDPLNRGRARTNLGSLLLRTGRYTAALSQFDAAMRDLIGPNANWADITPAQAQNADIFLLDQANAYLALNLLAEAITCLERCEAILSTADQPYELGQTLHTLGLLHLRSGNFTSAETSLRKAERLFRGLQNYFWLNRTAIALASLEIEQGALLRAATRLDALLVQQAPDLVARTTADTTSQWDVPSWVEAQLLRLRLHVAQNEISAARQCASSIAAAIGQPPTAETTPPLSQLAWPHWVLRWRHALGQIEQRAGSPALARRHFRAAISILESTRATLPIEEIRTAFLADKTALYADLVLSLLAESSTEAVAEAFAVVEQARARVLLERLLTATADQPDEAMDAALVAQRAALQQRLHWLYNQRFGETGSRRAATAFNAEIEATEAALQQLAWQTDSPLVESEPVGLDALQQALAVDQQALVYYIAGAEVMAFVVGRDQIEPVRRLCTVDALEEALARWRFQLERAEMGEQRLARHTQRYQQAWQAALQQLYQGLIAPLDSRLCATRLLIIPYGPLHHIPFHALWDGEGVLLERFECTYAPSASLAVRTLRQLPQTVRWDSLAGLALTDPLIPAARQEVETAAHSFRMVRLYQDAEATYANLRQAAAESDVLHLATHGRFRPDNPFFSMLKLADGWVDVRRLYRLPLAARLVVLSACESGAGLVRGGDEVIGVARGFLAAGAHALIASLWNVHDASTATLMRDFYAALTTNDDPSRPAAALRTAQLRAVRQRQHPFYWASFYLIGGA